MRLCRFRHQGRIQVGFYGDTHVVGLETLESTIPGPFADLAASDDLLDFLPPDGPFEKQIRQLAAHWEAAAPDVRERCAVPLADVQVLVPLPRPSKVLLLAGN